MFTCVSKELCPDFKKAIFVVIFCIFLYGNEQKSRHSGCFSEPPTLLLLSLFKLRFQESESGFYTDIRLKPGYQLPQ